MSNLSVKEGDLMFCSDYLISPSIKVKVSCTCVIVDFNTDLIYIELIKPFSEPSSFPLKSRCNVDTLLNFTM